MKRGLFLVLCLLLAPFPAHATAQAGDGLTLDGEELSLDTNPLAPWLSAHPDVLPKDRVIWTSNWRGYIAHFTVVDGMLMVDRVTVQQHPAGQDEQTVDILQRLFPGQQAVAADWFTGMLVIPRGELVHYVHMGYGSTYERYTLLDVRAGHVVERRDLSLAEFEAYRDARFEAYRKSDAFTRDLARLTQGEDAMSREMAEDFITSFDAEAYLSRPDATTP